MLALLCLSRISALVDVKNYCLLNERERILIMLVLVLGFRTTLKVRHPSVSYLSFRFLHALGTISCLSNRELWYFYLTLPLTV